MPPKASDPWGSLPTALPVLGSPLLTEPLEGPLTNPRLKRSSMIRLWANRLPITPLLGRGRRGAPCGFCTASATSGLAPHEPPHLACFQLLPPGLCSPLLRPREG